MRRNSHVILSISRSSTQKLYHTTLKDPRKPSFQYRDLDYQKMLGIAASTITSITAMAFLYNTTSYRINSSETDMPSNEGAQDKLKLALDKYKFAALYTIIMQPFAMPAQNLLAARNQNQKYSEAILQRLKNPVEFYTALTHNTIRRLGASVSISSFSSTISEELKLSKFETTALCVIIETSASIMLGEMGEKRKLVEAAAKNAGSYFSAEGFSQNVRNGSLASVIAMRNLLFTSAIFLVDPMAELILKLETSQQNNLSKDKIVRGLRFALTMASVIPENIANNLAAGKKITDILSPQNLSSLTRGALARGIYGNISSWAIATGFRIEEANRQKAGGLNLEEFIELTLNELTKLVPFIDGDMYDLAQTIGKGMRDSATHLKEALSETDAGDEFEQNTYEALMKTVQYAKAMPKELDDSLLYGDANDLFEQHSVEAVNNLIQSLKQWNASTFQTQVWNEPARDNMHWQNKLDETEKKENDGPKRH